MDKTMSDWEIVERFIKNKSHPTIIYSDALAALERLREERRWIPLSERGVLTTDTVLLRKKLIEMTARHEEQYAQAMALKAKLEAVRKETKRIQGMTVKLSEPYAALMVDNATRVLAILNTEPARATADEAARGEKETCNHVWGIDGQHFNQYCKKCFVSQEDAEPIAEREG